MSVFNTEQPKPDQEEVALTKRDLPLLVRAVRGVWDIPDSARKQAIDLSIATLDDPEATFKEKHDAKKILLMADGLNVKYLAIATPKQVIHREVDKLSDEEIDQRLQILEEKLRETAQEVQFKIKD